MVLTWAYGGTDMGRMAVQIYMRLPPDLGKDYLAPDNSTNEEALLADRRMRKVDVACDRLCCVSALVCVAVRHVGKRTWFASCEAGHMSCAAGRPATDDFNLKYYMSGGATGCGSLANVALVML
eukprot:708245-Rhodomonas_salina.1